MDIRHLIQIIFWTKWKEDRLRESIRYGLAAKSTLDRGNFIGAQFFIDKMLQKLSEIF